MDTKKPFSVDDAYALETPDDNIQLHAHWADIYDSHFAPACGYIVYQQAAEELVRQQENIRR